MIRDVYAEAVNAITGQGLKFVPYSGCSTPDAGQKKAIKCSMYKRKIDTTPKPMTYDFPGLVKAFSKPTIRPNKDGPLISFASLTGPRLNKNVTEVSAISLDFDHALPMAETIKLIHGFRFIAYTTFSHGTQEKSNAYRVIIFLKNPIPGNKYLSLWQYVNKWLPGIDQSCKDQSRMMYTPSCPSSRSHLYKMEWANGTGLDWESLDLKDQEQEIKNYARVPADAKTITWIQSGLKKIDPDVPYETWRDVGFILHDIIGGETGYDLWLEWTGNSSRKLRNDRVSKHWKSFDEREKTYRGNRLGLSAFARIAKEYGFDKEMPVKTGNARREKIRTWDACMSSAIKIGVGAIPGIAGYLSCKTPIEQNEKVRKICVELIRRHDKSTAAIKESECSLNNLKEKLKNTPDLDVGD